MRQQVSAPWKAGLTVLDLMASVMRWTPHLHEAILTGGTAKVGGMSAVVWQVISRLSLCWRHHQRGSGDCL